MLFPILSLRIHNNQAKERCTRNRVALLYHVYNAVYQHRTRIHTHSHTSMEILLLFYGVKNKKKTTTKPVEKHSVFPAPYTIHSFSVFQMSIKFNDYYIIIARSIPTLISFLKQVEFSMIVVIVC